MSIDLTSNFFKLLLHFRRQDLPAFYNEHQELFAEAKKSGHHLEVTQHYYSVMSAVIDEYFNGNFHFAAPAEGEQSLEDALRGLHHIIGHKLQLQEGTKCVDIGCGIGGVIRDLAGTGADLTGITIAGNEADMGNAELSRMGLSGRCRLVQADCHHMPMEEGAFDAAYAIYSLKYFPKLDPVMQEVSRVLSSGGRFLVYDLITTDKYDKENKEHTKVIEGLEFACGMPSLHTREEMIQAAARHGLTLESDEDLQTSHGTPYHYCFSHSPLFMWLVRSKAIKATIKMAEAMRILPKGFKKFNDVFLSGTVSNIVAGGEMGILSGSECLVFRKE